MSRNHAKNSNYAEPTNLIPLHEHFREYTAEEILEIKRNHCVMHKCPYLAKISWSSKSIPSIGGTNKQMMCNYILITGHSRGCMPDVCTHWSDKGVKVAPSNRHLFNKENHRQK